MSNTILDHWKMYFDGSLKLGGAGAGVLLISPDGKQLKYVLQILWQATNNEAEYEALIHGTKSTKIGTAPKKTWTLTVLKYENSKNIFKD